MEEERRQEDEARREKMMRLKAQDAKRKEEEWKQREERERQWTEKNMHGRFRWRFVAIGSLLSTVRVRSAADPDAPGYRLELSVPWPRGLATQPPHPGLCPGGPARG
jgi:hypothetical protein